MDAPEMDKRSRLTYPFARTTTAVLASPVFR
jgi:hypothetical protein